MNNNHIRHADGWTKKNAKYVKKIPKPGGGYYYIYPEDLKNKAKNALNTVKNTAQKAIEPIKNKAEKDANTLKEKLGVNAKETYNQEKQKAEARLKDNFRAGAGRPTFQELKTRSDVSKNINNYIKDEKAKYDATPLGKAEKAINDTKKKISETKDAVKNKDGVHKKGNTYVYKDKAPNGERRELYKTPNPKNNTFDKLKEYTSDKYGTYSSPDRNHQIKYTKGDKLLSSGGTLYNWRGDWSRGEIEEGKISRAIAKGKEILTDIDKKKKKSKKSKK